MNRYIKMLYAQVEPTMGHAKKGMLIIFYQCTSNSNYNLKEIIVTIG